MLATERGDNMGFCTLKVQGRMETITVEMPGATSIGYAAKRVAEAFDLDPELAWGLAEMRTGGARMIPEDAMVGEWNGALVVLVAP